MKLLSNTLDVDVEVWSDPGDYPNAVAQFPQRDCKYILEVIGECVVDLCGKDWSQPPRTYSHSDLYEFHPEVYTVIEDAAPDGVYILSWHVEFKDGKLELEVHEFEETI
jgi:hypothetical protein